MRPRTFALVAALASAACGYTVVRPRAEAAVTLGGVDDLSAEGGLGVVVRRRLRLALADEGEAGPRPLLSGTVRTHADHPVGYARGIAALYEQPVEVELRLTDATGRTTWTSGPRVRRAVFARGPTPLETEAARRAALADAARAAADDALAVLPIHVENPNP